MLFLLNGLLRETSSWWTRLLSKTKEVDLAPPPRLGAVLVEMAVRELGKGEDPLLGNNQGHDVVRYRGGIDDKGAWCADFVFYCYAQAAKRLYGSRESLPFKRSRSAKGLYRRIGKAGSFVKRPMVGDVVLFERGLDGDWKGHIGIVEQVDSTGYTSIEGNVGKVPARVKRVTHLFGADRFLGFARL